MPQNEPNFTIEIKNVNNNQSIIYEMKLKDKYLEKDTKLTYKSILDIIKLYYPQYITQYFSIMYKNQNGLWLFMTDDYSIDLSYLLESNSNQSKLRNINQNPNKLKLKIKYQNPQSDPQNSQNQSIFQNIQKLKIINKDTQKKLTQIKKLTNHSKIKDLKINIYLDSNLNQYYKKNIKKILFQTQKNKKNVTINIQKLSQQSLKKQTIKQNIVYFATSLIFNKQQNILYFDGETNKIQIQEILNRFEKVDLLILHIKYSQQKNKLMQLLSSKLKNIIIFKQNQKGAKYCYEFFLQTFFRQLFETICIKEAYQRSFEQTKDFSDEKIDNLIMTKFSQKQQDKFLFIEQGHLKCEFDIDNQLQQLEKQILKEYNQRNLL